MQLGGTFEFPISGWSLIKESCDNSRTNDDIDMKLGTSTKHYKGNKSISKRFYDDFMSVNCDFIVIFLIFNQYGAIRKPDSGGIVCKTSVFIISNL